MRIGVTCQDHNRPMPLCLWAACACACGLLELPRASIRGQHSNTPSFSDCKLTKKICWDLSQVKSRSQLTWMMYQRLKWGWETERVVICENFCSRNMICGWSRFSARKLLVEITLTLRNKLRITLDAILWWRPWLLTPFYDYCAVVWDLRSERVQFLAQLQDINILYIDVYMLYNYKWCLF